MPIFVSQISGIQSSIDKLDSKMEEEIKSIEGGSARSQPQETNKSIKSNQASPESNLVPKLSDLNIGTSPQLGGGGKKDADLEPKMEGDEATLKETMSECLNDENNDKLDTSMVNENVLENENNHTIFHNISYLGATRMDEPKNERLIQGNSQ